AINQAGQLQFIGGGIELWLVVMLDDVEVVVRRVESIDAASVEVVDTAWRYGRRGKFRRHVGKGHQFFFSAQGQARPERHASEGSGAENTGAQNLATWNPGHGSSGLSIGAFGTVFLFDHGNPS